MLADDSHEISYFIFQKMGKMSQNLSSAAVVIGAFRVNADKSNHCILLILSWSIGLTFSV